ncbi:HlyD family efflux transporter periplasmic adaptor subunit [Dyadobacter chenwenxiniae]|uniref:HlyD family efflux transporter periplasmic adaptor subunit n=1 Tax=Dyadobacter chenwenxiniae TaxID=2906456 RepID=A0A9X1PGK9_9BACT|nr:HlyD family efflux transporter periplasmic adaptor subunit [Dyadobacter chenwenxiniae]MCF0060353.1 HlyD family efflux transporter periplasmic adaptor subunit [Dyadobacter chenwenxiniae]UON86086.1 HlyD family efflux transporter periplasmic adaptor subunit [Dyadobacter chenwenxiniae]
MRTIGFILMIAMVFAGCKGEENVYDASGTFEAVETIVSAEATGRIIEFKLEEGQLLKAGKHVGYIDSLPLYLKKKQLEAQIKATGSKLPDIVAQTNVYKQQRAVSQVRLDNLLHEQKRIQNLLKADAATPKQLDDINAQISELQKQLEVISRQDAAQASVLKTQTSGLKADVVPLYVQIEQVNDQLAKTKIVNEVNGTVLSKYAEESEMAVTGKPLYKIADLSTIILRAYVTGDQLTSVKLNQTVKVLVDDIEGKYRELPGSIEWISDKAEFTPKTIQTKDERANLVYAVKIRLKNDGFLKIGMYGEVIL